MSDNTVPFIHQEIHELPFVDHGRWRYIFADSLEQFNRIWNETPARVRRLDTQSESANAGYRGLSIGDGSRILVYDSYHCPDMFVNSLLA